MDVYKELCTVIERAEEEFSGVRALNQDRFAEIEPACESAGRFAAGFGAGFLDIEIDNATGDLYFSAEVEDMIVRKDDPHGFYDLASASDGIVFEKLRGDKLRVSFRFDRLWSDV